MMRQIDRDANSDVSIRVTRITLFDGVCDFFLLIGDKLMSIRKQRLFDLLLSSISQQLFAQRTSTLQFSIGVQIIT